MLQEPNSNFSFDNLILGPPNGLQGGSYFTKLLLDNENIYLQIPKCQTKQGLVVTEKKKYCDLMFSRESTDIIAWFENIERKAQQLLFEKKNVWFHDDLEFSDIENAFTSPIRSYKSGNFYLVRCTVPKVITPDTISCYNENEEPVLLDEINEKDIHIIPIIEVQGIRFSSKNFQIELGLRQVMVIKKKELFKNCMIRVDKYDIENNTVTESIKDINHHSNEGIEEAQPVVEEAQPVVEEAQPVVEEETKKSSSIDEIDITTISSDSADAIKLKDPSEVYYEVWKKTRERAKTAKKEALKAYLEAKQIKEHYMLDVLESESESELESEVESSEDLEENECIVLA